MAQLQTTGVTGSLTVTGNITAQTLVVQQVTSSVLVVTGSTKFGSLTSNVQEFTGSLRVTGSGPHYIIGGNVGIGTSSPNHMLDILTDKTGNGAGSTIRLNRPNNASFENAINWATNGTSTWFLGSDNDSTDNFYLYNWLRGAFELTVLSGSGNVGIGTTAPGYKLSVIGGLVTAGTTATQLAFLGADGSNVAYVGSLTNHPFQIRVNNSTRVTIDTNGNVGIGSVTPGATLDVNGNVRATSFTGSFSGSITTSVGSNTQVIYNNAGVLAGSNNFTFNGTNVGIGTTNPTAILTIDAAEPRLRLNRSGVNHIIINHDGTTGTIRNESNTPLQIGTNGVAVMTITGSNVGIGATNPIGELQIGSSWTANPGGGNTIWLGTSGVANSNIAPDLIITSNTSATTPGGTIGLALHNSNTTAGAFSPLLVFSKTETGASPFNAAIAAIGARTVTGTGASDSYIDGDLIFYTSPTAGSGLVERLRIIQDGNVGIGTTSPITKLQINTSAYTGAGPGDSIRVSNNGSAWISADNSGSLAYFGAASTTTAKFAGYNYRTGTNIDVILGQESMYIKADGNVGIGTTSPTDFLHLYASGNDKFLKIENTNSYTGIWLQDSGANNGWLLMSGYTNVTSPGDFSIREYGVQTSLTIKSGSGNIGIGTISPVATLHVSSSAAEAFRITGGTVNGLYSTFFNGAIAPLFLGFGGTLSATATNNDGVIRYNSSYNLIFTRDGSEAARFNSSGNLGIGTTTPVNRLHVIQDGSTAGISVSGGTNPQLRSTDGTRIAKLQALSDRGIVGTESNNDFAIFANNSEAIRITTIGDVGIGTTSPSTFGGGGLTLGSTTTGKNLILNSSSAGNNGLIQFIDTAGNSAFQIAGTTTQTFLYSYGTRVMSFFTNNVERVRIQNDGNLGIGTTSAANKLTVAGDIESRVTVTTSTTNTIKLGTYTDGAWGSYITTGTNYASTLDTDLRLGVSVGGTATEVIRVSSTSNVGIGTTNPSVGKLQVNTGVASNNAVTIQATSQTSITYGIGIDASSNFAIYDNFSTAQRITMNGSGNVGIGTTTPGSKFEIKSSAANNLGGLLLRATSTSNFPAVLYENSSNGGTLDLYNGASLTTRINSNGDSYFNGGNVGIGTTVTSYNLDILSTTTGMLRIKGTGQGYTQASIILQTNASADTPQARGLGIYAFNEGIDANWYFGTPYRLAYADSFVVNRKANASFDVAAADPEDAANFLLINNVGNVGIGTTGPTTKLQVAGAISASLFQLGPTQFAARRYSNTVENITTGSYTTLFNVYGDALSSAIRIVVRGTANSVVIDSIIDITANHSEDIVIKSHSGIYTILTIKVLAAGTNTEDFTVQAKISGHEPGQPLQAYVDVYPYGNEIIEFSPGSIYSVTVLEHICTPGFNHSSIGGTSYFNINNGNVGIGTTTPATKLELQGNGSVLRLSTTSAPTTYYFDIESNYDSANTINFYGTAGNNFLKYVYNDNQLLLNPNGGRVGIGTTAAIGTLQVHGTLSISNNAVIGQGSTYGTPSAGSFSTLKLYDSSTGNTDLNNQTYDIQLLTAGSTKLIVKNNGNVGIGTTNPNTTLQVVGNARIGAISSTPANYSIDITAGGTANNAFVDFGYYNTFDAAIWFAGYFGDDSGKFKIRDASSGTTTDRLSIGLGTGVVTINNLAGTGDRIVGANSSGVLSAITVGSGLSLSGGTLTATGGSAGTVTGTGASSEMAYWTSTSNITGSSGFVYDATNGRVGINIASPTQRLDVRGTTYINNGVSTGAGEALIVEGSGDVRLTNGGSIFWGAYSYAASTYIQAYDDQDGIYFYSNGTFSTIMRSSGVGIGVSLPTAYLDVRGAQDTAGLISLQLRAGNSAANFSSNQITFGYNNTDTYRHAIKSRHNSSAASGNSIDFYTWKQGTDSSAAIGTQHVMSIDGLNVGIGTTGPIYKLETITGGTNGFRLQTATSTVGNPQIDLYDSGRTQETVISSTDGTTTGTYIASYSNHPLLLGTYAGSSPTARVAISTGGYVGIGTVSPLTNLQIKNNVSAGGFANFTDYQIILWATTTPAASYGFGIESNTLMYHSANTHRFYIANSAIGALTSAGFQVRYRPQVNTQTTPAGGTLTPDVSESTWHVTALSTSLTIASPSGTANNGERLIIRITDNGTPQSLTFNSIYRAGTDVSLPTITTANKTMYLGFIYNSTNTKWDLVAKVNGI